LGKLAALGVRLAIDDFGSGYSSLMRLRQMPISVLKIDRFFVQNIATNPRDAAIVAAVVGMAHSLGLTVVVEGVETRAQLAALRTLDAELDTRTTCDRIQGYLLSKPDRSDFSRSSSALSSNVRTFRKSQQIFIVDASAQ
jgi:EAL domain-containing protein (putative c-di-GMP-specific phosphodiesterase class I)